MIIGDGHGTGNKAQVTDEGCICTKAISVHFTQHINEKGDAYSVIIEKTPTGAGDCFFYIKNNDDQNMYVCSLTGAAATDETVQIKIRDIGTPAGTTANVPVNRNASSGKEADVTCYDGVDITGLSGGSVVEQFELDGATGSRKFRYNSCIIIPKNQTLSLYAVTGAIALKISLGINFHD